MALQQGGRDVATEALGTVARIIRLGGITKFIVSPDQPITESMHAETHIASDTLSTEVGLQITSLYRTPQLSSFAVLPFEAGVLRCRRTCYADQNRFDG